MHAAGSGIPLVSRMRSTGRKLSDSGGHERSPPAPCALRRSPCQRCYFGSRKLNRQKEFPRVPDTQRGAPPLVRAPPLTSSFPKNTVVLPVILPWTLQNRSRLGASSSPRVLPRPRGRGSRGPSASLRTRTRQGRRPAYALGTISPDARSQLTTRERRLQPLSFWRFAVYQKREEFQHKNCSLRH